MTDADAALLRLGHQLTADVVACSLMLAQVKGYERVEHGKVEEVRSYVEGLNSKPAEAYQFDGGLINDYLRTGSMGMGGGWFASSPEKMAEIVHGMDELIDKAPPLAAQRLYRWQGEINPKPGDVLTDKAYGSFSREPGATAQFGTHMLIVNVPAGAKGLDINALTKNPNLVSQHETVLPRGHRLLVRSSGKGMTEADLLPPEPEVQLAQAEHVKGYERTVHGKTEFVGPYDRLGRRRIWVSSDGEWLLRLGHNGALQVRKSFPGLFRPWREVDPTSPGTDDYYKIRPWADILKEGAVEVTTPRTLPVPTGPVADPHVVSDPGMPDPKVVQDFLKAHLTPAELDVLNKERVTWHLEPQAKFNKRWPHSGIVGMYIGATRAIHISGDAMRSMDRAAVLKQLDVEEEPPHGVQIGPPYGDDWQHVILHETGHALDHALGFPSNRDKRFQDYAAAAFPPGTHAAQNPGESFAELFGAMRSGEWADPAAGYPQGVPEDIQHAEEEYVERAEREGVPLSAGDPEPRPLCVARYLPGGTVAFGPPDPIKGE